MSVLQEIYKIDIIYHLNYCVFPVPPKSYLKFLQKENILRKFFCKQVLPCVLYGLLVFDKSFCEFSGLSYLSPPLPLESIVSGMASKTTGAEGAN